MKRIIKYFLPLIFPEGICPGEDSNGNVNLIARDGQGNPVLRGTSIAGVLRTSFAEYVCGDRFGEEVSFWFGEKCDSKNPIGRQPSKLSIPDCIFKDDVGGQLSVPINTHNAVNRHSGAVLDKSLFSIEKLPPGVKVNLIIKLDCEDLNDDEIKNFSNFIYLTFSNAIYMGGNLARGIGYAKLIKENAGFSDYKLDDYNQLKKFLNDEYQIREQKIELVPDKTFDELKSEENIENKNSILNVEVKLTISRGQDLVIGDTNALDYDVQMQSVTGADGKKYWRLPGSSFRGVFRNWFNRLAAKDGFDVADNIMDYFQKGIPTADELAWCRIPKEQRKEFQKHPENIPCVVSKLFGSLFAKGRIHFRDIIIPEKNLNVQHRMHVAIDMISGGANEGSLFDNNVLTDKDNNIFNLNISLKSPTEQEIKWLIKTLHAIDSGLLRVGSSKAAGRLSIENISAMGPLSELFNNESWIGNNSYSTWRIK